MGQGGLRRKVAALAFVIIRCFSNGVKNNSDPPKLTKSTDIEIKKFGAMPILKLKQAWGKKYGRAIRD